MRSIIVLLLLTGIAVSGCLENPIKQVPVVKVNVTFAEKEGIVYAENVTYTQGTVDYAGRPRTPISTFPAITGRTLVTKNNTGSTESAGKWESLPFKGNGNYKFNIGFNENYYPDPGDIVHVSIMVVDENGNRIGYLVNNMNWE